VLLRKAIQTYSKSLTGIPDAHHKIRLPSVRARTQRAMAAGTKITDPRRTKVDTVAQSHHTRSTTSSRHIRMQQPKYNALVARTRMWIRQNENEANGLAIHNE
jgi:hypothetical protein